MLPLTTASGKMLAIGTVPIWEITTDLPVLGSVAGNCLNEAAVFGEGRGTRQRGCHQHMPFKGTQHSARSHSYSNKYNDLMLRGPEAAGLKGRGHKSKLSFLRL